MKTFVILCALVTFCIIQTANGASKKAERTEELKKEARKIIDDMIAYERSAKINLLHVVFFLHDRNARRKVYNATSETLNHLKMLAEQFEDLELDTENCYKSAEMGIRIIENNYEIDTYECLRIHLPIIAPIEEAICQLIKDCENYIRELDKFVQVNNHAEMKNLPGKEETINLLKKRAENIKENDSQLYEEATHKTEMCFDELTNEIDNIMERVYSTTEDCMFE